MSPRLECYVGRYGAHSEAVAYQGLEERLGMRMGEEMGPMCVDMRYVAKVLFIEHIDYSDGQLHRKRGDDIMAVSSSFSNNAAVLHVAMFWGLGRSRVESAETDKEVHEDCKYSRYIYMTMPSFGF